MANPKTVVDMTQRERRAIQMTRFLALRTYEESPVSETQEASAMKVCELAAAGDKAALDTCLDFIDSCEALVGDVFQSAKRRGMVL